MIGTKAKLGDYKQALRLDPCSYCGSPNVGPLEIDHIEPRSRGGANEWANLTGACFFCNRTKFDGSMLEWLLAIRDLKDFGPPPYAYWVTFSSRATDETRHLVWRRSENQRGQRARTDWRMG